MLYHTYTRDDWGAVPPRWPGHKIGEVGVAVVHHDAGSVPSSASVALRRAKTIQHQHQYTNQLTSGGGRDVAYSRFVFAATNGEHGVIDARGFGVANGATQNMGSRSVAWCVMGNFSLHTPSELLYELLAADMRYAVNAGWLSSAPAINRHRDYAATQCPGDEFDINRVRHLFHHPRTPINPSTPTEVFDMGITANELRSIVKEEVDKLLWERGSNPLIILEGDPAHYILGVDRQGPFLVHIRNPDADSALAVYGGRNRRPYHVPKNSPLHSAMNTIPKTAYPAR